MSRKGPVLLLSIAITAAVVSFSALSVVGPRDNSTYGPLKCDACQVATPAPDRATEVYIAKWIQLKKFTSRDPFVGIGAGGRMIICNSIACATYQRTNSGDWHGIRQEYIKKVVPPRVAKPQKPKGEGERPGGGNGRGWNGGGWNGGGWNGGGGTPKRQVPDVKVGTPEQQK